MINFPKGKKIILFDGFCNLCDASVQYVIKHDKKDIFRFVAIQSDLGQKLLNHIGINSKNIDSVVLYEPGVAYYYKSSAAIIIANNLSGLFTLATLFKLIPTKIRNLVYDYVAKNRYKWYGKKEQCLLPTEPLKGKFLSEL
jgi:predicted DCC family thiol-disulfide oxidoreductase YuxK